MSDQERREFARESVALSGKLDLADGLSPLTCLIEDISVGGAKVHLRQELDRHVKGQGVVLHLESYGKFEGKIAWIKGERVGLRFNDNPEKTAEALIGLLSYAVV